MRSGKVTAEIFAAALFNAANRKPGSVCGNERAWAAVRFDFSEECALDIEIFRDRFDDPIGFGAPIEIVFKVANLNAARDFWREECGGAGLQGAIESRSREAIPDGGVGESETFRFFGGVELRRNDVEEKCFDARVGEVRGDARAHGAGAENGDAIDAEFHLSLKLRFRG